jgi:hypothetical protein
MAKTRKIRGGDKKSDCMDSKCKLWLEEAEKNITKLRLDFEKRLKDMQKKRLKSCKKSPDSIKSLSKKEPTECEQIKKHIKWIQVFLDKLEESKKSGKGDKLELAACAKIYCNEGCKNTILEDGAPDKLSIGLKKVFKNNKQLIRLMENTRKTLFGNKTTVLKDDFFKGIKAKSLKKLKKEGAISGCARNI